MTFWAKLLIVVVFILSLVFASVSAALFGRREDYRDQLEKAKAAYAQEKDSLTRKNAAMTDQVNQAVKEVAEAKSNADAAQLRLDTAIHEAERKAGEYAAKDIENQKVKDLNVEQAASLGKLGVDLKDAIADRERAETEDHTLTRQAD